MLFFSFPFGTNVVDDICPERGVDIGFDWCAISIFITFFVYLMVTLRGKILFINKICLVFLIHFILLDLYMHVQSYGCLQLNGSV